MDEPNKGAESEPCCRKCKCKESKVKVEHPCETCGHEKLIGERADTDLLLRIAREELAWHNDRAISFVNRSTAWLALLGLVLPTIFKGTLLSHPEKLHAFAWPLLMAGLVAFAVASWQLFKVVSLVDVTIFDTNTLTRFVSYFKNKENIYCAHCYALRELLTRDMPESETRLESAEKEADKRAKHYRKALLAISWGTLLLALAIISEIAIRNIHFELLVAK